MQFRIALTNGNTVTFERDTKTGAIYITVFNDAGTVTGDALERNEDFKRMAAILCD